jgi:hypothetical protein
MNQTDILLEIIKDPYFIFYENDLWKSKTGEDITKQVKDMIWSKTLQVWAPNSSSTRYVGISRKIRERHGLPRYSKKKIV